MGTNHKNQIFVSVAYYTDIVGAVPTAYSSINNICSSSTGATNTTTVQDQQNKSRRLGTSPAATKAHLYVSARIYFIFVKISTRN